MAKPKAPEQQTQEKSEISASRKKKIYWVGGGLFCLLITMLIMVSGQGSMYYGICRVYVELHELYPGEITYLSVDDDDPVKIFYKKIDPFGVDSVNSIECQFKKDSNGQLLYELSKVDINERFRTYDAEKPENIKRFNVGIPAILDNPPNLDLPNFSQDNILEYKDSD